ncbi:hypothetical protein BpOF4_16965 [Alkalihalophilus pseudofirmus OF4]|uniref:Uncharacterized protein n=1 Tax=Alkalihalophilus pseudofirmus (strain ATCC BAA-2126 / JCM 17055 / OF4) TaxID=398511 RepID=D3FQR6_ALKPO|nr:hypothetical protein [Alkalihalophilus pseudofirmus]ADC51436.1 hypothetical protein BpOF4_16965 [Alkalihalophilus pseudofirmus OF4]
MKKKKYISIGLVALIIFITINLLNDYREKNLDDVLSYNPSKFHSLDINFELHTTNPAYAEELTEFLSQYRVKKMSAADWDRDLKAMEGFHVSINSNNRPSIMASIYEDRIHHYDGNYYKVINGPIHVEWLNSFIEELENVPAN